MHAEFQKWGLVVLKKGGPTLQNVGLINAINLSITTLLNLGITELEKRDVWQQVIAKISGTYNILQKAARPYFASLSASTQNKHVLKLNTDLRDSGR